MAKPPTERDPLRAAQLKKAREARNLTQSALERAAGVSRKHISDAEQGVNISVAVLAKLMRALGMREITVGGDLTIRTAGAEGDLMIAVADQIERATEEMAGTLTGLVTFIRHQAGRSDETSPEAKLRDRAAALARRFAEQVRHARPEELAALEATFDRVARPERKTPAARRKRAG